MASVLLIELLNKEGKVLSLPSVDVKDCVTLDEVTDILKELLDTTDVEGLKDTIVLLNAYLVIELGPKQADIVWDKLFDKNLNDVTKILR
jgi:hypothetical protein